MAKKDNRMPDYSSWTLEQLMAERRRQASAANRQMQRWKKAGMAELGAAYRQYAVPYLRQFGPERATFHTGKKPISGKTERGQRQAEIRELNALWRYMNAKTYTIAGYREVKQRAIEGLGRSVGVEPGSPEMARLHEQLSKAADDLVSGDQWTWVKRTLGSEVIRAIAKGIAEGRATKKEMLERIDQMILKETAGTNYAELTFEEYMRELGLDDSHVSEPEEEE